MRERAKYLFPGNNIDKTGKRGIQACQRSISNLCVVVVGPFIVGQLQLAKRDFLPHPVSTGVRRFRMNVHFVT